MHRNDMQGWVMSSNIKKCEKNVFFLLIFCCKNVIFGPKYLFDEQEMGFTPKYMQQQLIRSFYSEILSDYIAR